MKRRYYILIAVLVCDLFAWYAVRPYRTINHRWEPPKFPWYVDGIDAGGFHNNLFIYGNFVEWLPCVESMTNEFNCTSSIAIPDQWRGKDRVEWRDSSQPTVYLKCDGCRRGKERGR